MASPGALVRVVVRPDGDLAFSAASAGRGAWFCRESRSCIEAAARRNGLSRALRVPISTGAIARLCEDVGLPGAPSLVVARADEGRRED